jgi:hypothetical protein
MMFEFRTSVEVADQLVMNSDLWGQPCSSASEEAISAGSYGFD